MLCASLPLAYKETERTGSLVEKLFPSEERSVHDSYGQYPWSKDERTKLYPSDSRSHDENTASKFQIEQIIRDREMKRNILQELLDWEKRKLGQPEQSEKTNEKREPQNRCYGGNWGCHKGKRGEVSSNEMTLDESEAGRSLMDDKDIDRIKQYDMEVERALREWELEVHSGKKM
ncbi:hypothetical protein ACROYT_G033774 [Oculina patagonica]